MRATDTSGRGPQGPSTSGASDGSSSGAEGLDSIKIYCRFAPITAAHQSTRTLNHDIYPCTSGGSTVVVRDDYSGATLDMDCEQAFDGQTSQATVHSQVTEPMIPRLLQGYNCTLLAFGQTASGKTHTMLGPQGGQCEFLKRDEYSGIVPRVVTSLFEHLEASDMSADVDFSYFEIYNEVVSDLIAKATSCDGDERSFSFKGTDKARFEREVSRVRVRSADEFLHILQATNVNRQQGGTDLNHVSSRSHSIVLLRVSTASTAATMCMVDLAGSECIKKSNAQGLRRYETKNINTSLFALKQVIHALYKRKEHIPYADSMLTRSLADSLRGNAYLRILVCCTSRAEDAGETMTTLRFGKEASSVVRKPPVVNRFELLRDRQLYSQLEFDALTQEKAALAATNAELLAENETARNDNAVLRMQVRQLQDANSQLAQQLQQGKDAYQTQVAALQQQYAELKQNEHQTSEQNVYLSHKVTEVQKHMDGILSQIKAVTLENDMLRNELRQSRGTVDGLRQSLTQHTQQLASAAAHPPRAQHPQMAADTSEGCAPFARQMCEGPRGPAPAASRQRAPDAFDPLTPGRTAEPHAAALLGHGLHAGLGVPPHNTSSHGGSAGNHTNTTTAANSSYTSCSSGPMGDSVGPLQQQQQSRAPPPPPAGAGIASPSLIPPAAIPSLTEPLITAEQDALTARLQRLEQVLLRPAAGKRAQADTSAGGQRGCVVPP